MSERTITTETVEGVGGHLFEVELVRSGMGQVIEYDVYVTDKTHGERTYEGGGSKREARAIFNRMVKKFTPRKAAL